MLLCVASFIHFDPETYHVNEHCGLVQPTLILSNPSSTNITVQVKDSVDTASRKWTNSYIYYDKLWIYVGTDYDPGPYNVIFPAGKTRMFFDVVINRDDIIEEDEVFILYIDSLPNGILFDSDSDVTAIITIRRNDGKLKYW